MDTLEQTQEKIEFKTSQIEQFFKTINTPDNIIISKDRYWGKRSILIRLRLDEFSINRLKELMPKLELFFNEYNKLRQIEREISDKLDIEQAIRARLNIGINSI